MATMTELKALVKEGRAQGKGWVELAALAKAAGHLSTRTQEPYSNGGLSTLALRKGWVKRERTHYRKGENRGKAAPSTPMMELIEEVVTAPSMAEATKLELIKRIVRAEERA